MKVKIMQGLPGSGKSTFAKSIKEEYKDNVVILSTDDYFIVNGKYKFDAVRIKEAHDWCLRLYSDFLRGPGTDILIIDNTNLSVYEIAPYYRLAEAFGHDVIILRINIDPVIAFVRNIHGVPLDVITKMSERFEREKNLLPPWWKIQNIT